MLCECVIVLERMVKKRIWIEWERERELDNKWKEWERGKRNRKSEREEEKKMDREMDRYRYWENEINASVN